MYLQTWTAPIIFHQWKCAIACIRSAWSQKWPLDLTNPAKLWRNKSLADGWNRLIMVYIYIYSYIFYYILYSGHLSTRLSNGVEMPAIGFGTWKLEGEDSVLYCKDLQSIWKHSDSSGSTRVLEVFLTYACLTVPLTIVRTINITTRLSPVIW